MCYSCKTVTVFTNALGYSWKLLAPAGCMDGQWMVYVVEAVGVGGWAGNLHFGYGVPGK